MRTLMWWVLLRLILLAEFVWLAVSEPADWVRRGLRRLEDWAEIELILAKTRQRIRRGR